MLFVHYAVAVAILATQLLPVNADEQTDEPNTLPIVSAEPASLNDAVPTCSRFCVDMFIKNNYPPVVCSDPTDLECLCTKNSTSGLTIAEGAISCVAYFCLNVSPSLSTTLLNLCSQFPGALPNHHRPSTQPFFSAPSETQQYISSTSTSTSTTTMTMTMTMTIYPSTVTRTTSTATGTFTGNVGAQETTSPPSKSSHSSDKLSDPAIVGISIVGAAALILAGALLYLCLRRQRRKSMVVKGDIADESGDASPYVPRDPVPKYETAGSTTGTITQQTPPAHTDPIPPPPAMARTSKASPNPDEIGVAIYPDYIEGSPNSQTSRRTDSQLLPDKPNYSLYPEPLRWSQRAPPKRESYMTVFEEDMSEGNKPNCGPVVTGCSHGVGLPSDPRALMYAMERRNKLAPNGSAGMPAQQSNTTLSIPSEGNYQNFVTMPTERLDAHHAASFGQNPMCSNRHCSSLVRGSSQTPKAQNRPTCNHVSHSHSEVQRDTFDSFASNTTSSSRESCIEDDYGLPDRVSGAVTRLSPVQEASTPCNNMGHSSPQSATSVSYPKMPRSASVAQQAETAHEPRAAHLMKATASSARPKKNPKSPPPIITTQQHQPQSVNLYLCPQHSPSASNYRSENSASSTLLAKRRGDTVADKMENGLHLSSISKSSPNMGNTSRYQENETVAEEKTSTKPDKGNGSGSTGTHKQGNVPLREVQVFEPPHREVRLTPTRKGPDLFLNVEHR